MSVRSFDHLEDDPRRRHAPATARNREVIHDLLVDALAHIPAGPGPRFLLEIASGTGEHAAHLAPRLDRLLWQPSDIDPDHLTSIEAWRDVSDSERIKPPLTLDVSQKGWSSGLASPDLILSANLVHIAPIEVGEQMILEAGPLLADHGLMLLYGPFKVGGKQTSESNEDFEDWLKSKDPRYGVRDREWAVERAARAGLTLREARPMPANNFTLIFEKQG